VERYRSGHGEPQTIRLDKLNGRRPADNAGLASGQPAWGRGAGTLLGRAEARTRAPGEPTITRPASPLAPIQSLRSQPVDPAVLRVAWATCEVNTLY